MGNMRRAGLVVEYQGDEITRYLEEYILKMNVTDNFKGAIDELTLTLRNDKNRFLNPDWALELYKQLRISIVTMNWRTSEEGKKVYPVGVYNIDSRNFSRSSIDIKALAIPLGEAQDQLNTKTWNEITFSSLAEEFAKKYNLEFQFLVDSDPKLKNLRQEKETDFSFLQKIADEEGANLKIAFNKLVIFDEEKYENAAPIMDIDINELDYRISEKTKEVYDAVEITYINPSTNETEKMLLVDSGKNKIIRNKKKKSKERNPLQKYFDGTAEEAKENNPLEKHFGTKETEKKKPKLYNKLLKLNKRSKSGNIQEFARKRLKKANAKRIEIFFTMVGDMQLYAGTTFNLLNAGIFQGKYMIQKIVKTVPGMLFSVEAYLVEAYLKEENGELIETIIEDDEDELLESED